MSNFKECVVTWSACALEVRAALQTKASLCTSDSEPWGPWMQILCKVDQIVDRWQAGEVSVWADRTVGEHGLLICIFDGPARATGRPKFVLGAVFHSESNAYSFHS